jgi:hypothetical protein
LNHQVDDFMTPIAKYYQFPRELWAGKEAAWDQGIQQADAQFKKLFVSEREPGGRAKRSSAK